MNEQTFLNAEDIVVTNARFVVSGKTYAMNGVTSVRFGQKDPRRWGPILLFLYGGVNLLPGLLHSEFMFVAVPAALLFMGPAIFWWTRQKPVYSVVLTTAAGEAQALSSKDESLVRRVVDALNSAIIARG